MKDFNMSVFKKMVGIGIMSGIAFAAPHSLDELKNIAVNFAKTKSPAIKWETKEPLKTSLLSGSNDIHKNFKIIQLKPTGWVIVSTDDVARPVLAYNLEENNTGKVPVNFKNWMEYIDEEIEWAKNKNGETFLPDRWKLLTLAPEKFSEIQSKDRLLQATPESSNIKAPLLSTTWNQGKYYNEKCPKDPEGPDGHVYAGCVATAMTQIMKYYNWPLRGKGRHSYESDYGTLSVNFGRTRYKWKKMPNKLSSYNNSVATLLYHAGVAVDMQYSAEGSGAYMRDADKALKTYFRYQTSGRAFKNNMTTTEWETLLKTELDKNRPVFYAGYGTGGHAFVCDGYDYSDKNNKKYHFNWGWGGYYNGYFALEALNPGSGDFNDNNEIIYGIIPVGLLKAPTNIVARNIKKKSVVLRWKDRTKNEKGFRIYQGETLIREVKANTTKTKISHLIPGTKYTLRVAAYTDNAESAHIPVQFKTKGKRPQILPLQLNTPTEGKLTSRKKSLNRPDHYAEYYTFRLRNTSNVKILVHTNDFYAGIYLMEGKSKTGDVIYKTYTYYKGTLEENVNLEAGTYTIEVTSFYSDTQGKFTIEVKN